MTVAAEASLQIAQFRFKTGEPFSEQRTLIFKTRQVWQPQAGSVRLRGRSVPKK